MWALLPPGWFVWAVVESIPGGTDSVLVGDEDAFAEQVFFQRGAGVVIDAPGQPEVAGRSPVTVTGSRSRTHR